MLPGEWKDSLGRRFTGETKPYFDKSNGRTLDFDKELLPHPEELDFADCDYGIFQTKMHCDVDSDLMLKAFPYFFQNNYGAAYKHLGGERKNSKPIHFEKLLRQVKLWWGKFQKYHAKHPERTACIMQVIVNEGMTENDLEAEGLGDLLEKILLHQISRNDFPAGFFKVHDVSLEIFCCLLLVL